MNDKLNFLGKSYKSGGPVVASVARVGGNFNGNVGDNQLEFNQVYADTHGIVDNFTSGKTQFIIPRQGLYRLCCTLNDQKSAARVNILYIVINGISRMYRANTAYSSSDDAVTIEFSLPLNTGDRVTFVVNCSATVVFYGGTADGSVACYASVQEIPTV